MNLAHASQFRLTCSRKILIFLQLVFLKPQLPPNGLNSCFHLFQTKRGSIKELCNLCWPNTTPMKMNRSCACKGIRSCVLCENAPESEIQANVNEKFLFCSKCNRCRSMSKQLDEMECLRLSHCDGTCNLDLIRGVFLADNFLTEDEEQFLIDNINKTNWVESQSGRYKQDYGPKVNFKKKKLKIGQFTGLPSYARFVVERLQSTIDFKDFVPVELCNLKYSKDRGASIDPHVDDMWIWGPRLLTFNLASDTYLTMTPSAESLASGVIDNCEILIPLKRRTFVCLNDDARYKWLHSIKRNHITDTPRIAITLRELSSLFKMDEAEAEIGSSIEQIALSFNG
jgi:alkylated DNA repair protein alkB family protein 4